VVRAVQLGGHQQPTGDTESRSQLGQGRRGRKGGGMREGQARHGRGGYHGSPFSTCPDQALPLTDEPAFCHGLCSWMSLCGLCVWWELVLPPLLHACGEGVLGRGPHVGLAVGPLAQVGVEGHGRAHTPCSLQNEREEGREFRVGRDGKWQGKAGKGGHPSLHGPRVFYEIQDGPMNDCTLELRLGAP
jgi:hypothetical protein